MENDTRFSNAVRRFMVEHHLEASDIRDLAENLAAHLLRLEPQAVNTARDIRNSGRQMETILDEIEDGAT